MGLVVGVWQRDCGGRDGRRMGRATQTYMVTVTRAGSSDARLSALSLSGMMLSPTFASGTAAYTATVGHGVTETTVTASVVAGAANEIKLNGIVDEDGIVPLAVGADNVITVIVTAQDGKTTQTYTVTVTRAGLADASLSALSLMGEGGGGRCADALPSRRELRRIRR